MRPEDLFTDVPYGLFRFIERYTGSNNRRNNSAQYLGREHNMPGCNNVVTDHPILNISYFSVSRRNIPYKKKYYCSIKYFHSFCSTDARCTFFFFPFVLFDKCNKSCVLVGLLFTSLSHRTHGVLKFVQSA